MPAATEMGNVTDFRGRTVIVTGGARGIGLAVSRAFAVAGAEVWILDVDGEEAAAAAKAAGTHALACDITKTSDVERVVAEIVAESGAIDVIFNNAGLLRDKMLWKLDDDDWDAVIAVSLGGTFKLTRACVPHFRERGYGRIVNVTSYTGLHGNVGQAAYAAAKAGVIGFTKTAAKELARFGVTVNAISPNAKTRMTDSIPSEIYQQLEKQTPLGRFGEPEEISAAVLFLASEAAGYITGAVLPVDGGIAI
jgi:3-oxoacyl-[acyl-carrier protein] reductase